jgi:hypothetical protein
MRTSRWPHPAFVVFERQLSMSRHRITSDNEQIASTSLPLRSISSKSCHMGSTDSIYKVCATVLKDGQAAQSPELSSAAARVGIWVTPHLHGMQIHLKHLARMVGQEATTMRQIGLRSQQIMRHSQPSQNGVILEAVRSFPWPR